MPHIDLPMVGFKVVMLGDTFTGKTSLVLRFAEGHYRDSARSATVGAFFITKRLTVQGTTCKLQIWDTAGQDQFRKLAPMYYKSAAAAIVCYDVTSPKSFETLKYWLGELEANIPPGRMVIAICATKCDLATSPPESSPAAALAQQTGALFMATSAKNNDNVSELFEMVSDRVLTQQKENEGVDMPISLGVPSMEAQDDTIRSSSSYLGNSKTRIGTPSRKLETINSEGDMVDEKKLEDDEDGVVDTGDSQDSSADVNTRCDANMLMCGDPVMLGASAAQSCTIL